jgi:endonuclease/exonuclease/phosphatase family metal-dependent hydrolase
MRRTSIVLCAVMGFLLAVALPSLGDETAFSLMTWNIQGYPESTWMQRIWFTDSIEDYEPTILCIQEIAYTANVDAFVATEYVTSSAFVESPGVFDNVIFLDSPFTLWNASDPAGFLRPAQLIVLLIDGHPYYILTVHLAETDASLRAAERALLSVVVDSLLLSSQYVMLSGTFYTTGTPGDTIEELAADLGLVWLVPDNYDRVGTKYTEERYDHILVSSTIVESWVIETEIIEFDMLELAKEVSDHRPVLAEFSPIPPPVIPYEPPPPPPPPDDDEPE